MASRFADLSDQPWSAIEPGLIREMLLSCFRSELMKAYSQDLREHVLRAVNHGYPRTEIVQMFGISLATLRRYIKQRRDEGHVRPKAIPGRLSKKRAQVEASVLPQ